LTMDPKKPLTNPSTASKMSVPGKGSAFRALCESGLWCRSYLPLILRSELINSGSTGRRAGRRGILRSSRNWNEMCSGRLQGALCFIVVLTDQPRRCRQSLKPKKIHQPSPLTELIAIAAAHEHQCAS
jgi:hypothetical protein